MDENATLKYLERMRINYELVTHPAIFNMAEAEAVKLPHPEAEAKNLFICDKNKRDILSKIAVAPFAGAWIEIDRN